MANGEGVACGKHEAAIESNRNSIQYIENRLTDLDRKVDKLSDGFAEFRGSVSAKIWIIFALIAFVGGIVSPVVTYAITNWAK